MTSFTRHLSNVSLYALLLGCLLWTSGCLVLRSEMSPNAPVNPQKHRQSPQVAELQKEKAELELKLKGYDEQFRELLGRIEEMESKAGAQGDAASQDKVKDLESALSEMVAQQEALKKEIADLKSSGAKSSPSEPRQTKATGDLGVAEKHFSTGNWSVAIEEFQKYRELNPKSTEIPLVTYKIGVCFQELGMKSEARTFYNSVIKRFPNDRAAKFAKFRLDSL